MRIPYIKLYASDLLAASRSLTSQQLGRALVGICERAFENNTTYQPQDACERAFFRMLLVWEKESRRTYMACVRAGRKGGRKTQQNSRVQKQQIVGSGAGSPA